jgi:hypothetical protein
VVKGFNAMAPAMGLNQAGLKARILNLIKLLRAGAASS